MILNQTEDKMKKIISIITVIGCFSGVFGESSFNVGFSGSDEGIDSFNFSIGNYYGVPVQEVREVEYYVPREHASIVYFLAKHSHKDARYITQLRRDGLSWWNISLHLGLNPYTLYTVDNNRYYGKSKHHRLHDSEIADYVNVRFISDYHHINRNEVIDRRRNGERYYNINDSYSKKQDRTQYREERKVETIHKERKEEKRDMKDNRRDDRNRDSNSDNKRKNHEEKRNSNSHER